MYHERPDPGCRGGAPPPAGADREPGQRSPSGQVGPAEATRRFPEIDAAVWSAADARFPVRVTRSWAARVEHAGDPLGRQVFPEPAELVADPGDRPDPVGEAGRRPVPWVVRKHEDRLLLLVTRRCHLNCRFCFRRDQAGPAGPTPAELERALDYVRRSGVREVILSGGDPLVLGDARLASILDALRPAVPVLRIHTRAPVSAPERVSPSLVRLLRERAPVWVVVHANHPREFAADVDAALASLVDGGVPVLAQTVLLRGVNDDPDVLARLFADLLARRVVPYTLHHTDPVPGNAAFRVGLDRGLAIWRELSARIGGVGLPRYVIDPPDGSGKVPVPEWAARRPPTE